MVFYCSYCGGEFRDKVMTDQLAIASMPKQEKVRLIESACCDDCARTIVAATYVTAAGGLAGGNVTERNVSNDS